MGTGSTTAKIMLIGEALGQQEALTGIPFTGSAGKLLNDALEKAGLTRNECYLTNVIKCRPPENRSPSKAECKLCLPFLLEEIKTVKPKVIGLLGSTSLEIIAKLKGISRIRGNVFDIDIEGVIYKIIPIWHPAYVLRFPELTNLKDELVKDLKLAKEVSEKENYVKTKTPVRYELVEDEKDVEKVFAYLEKIKLKKIVSYDIETTGFNFLKDEILSIALSCEENEGICMTGSIYYNLVLPKLKSILESPEILKIAHNLKFDNKFLKTSGINVKLPLSDTMLSHYLLDENSTHGLKELAWKYTDMGGYDDGVDYKEFTHEKFYSDAEFRKKIMTYNVSDTDCTLRLYSIFKPELIKEKLDKVNECILIPLSQVFLETEYDGVPLDIEYMDKLEKEIDAKIADIEFRMLNSIEIKTSEKLINTVDIKVDNVVVERKIIPPEDKKYKKFNLKSTHDLQVLLYKVLNLHALKQTKTGYSTDKESMDYLQGKHPFVDLLLQYRGITHDKSAYIVQMRNNLDSRGRVHTDYGLHKAVTGRPQSAEPNLQNIPRTSHIKRLFIAEPGCLLLSADYKQIEYRVWINFANSKKGLEDIARGLDIHSEVCCMVWPQLYKKVSEGQYQVVATGDILKKIDGRDDTAIHEHRVSAKNVVFGVIYGRGIKSLMAEYKLSEAECNKIWTNFFAMYPEAEQWLENQKKFVKKYKYVKNMFGRIRRLPEIDSNEEEFRATAIRQSCNTPVQSSASDILSTGTIRIFNLIKNNNMKSKLFFSIHDALKYNVPLSELDMAIQVITKGMGDPIPGVNFPLEVEFEIGPSWGEMIGLEEFNEDREKYLKLWRICK